MCGIIGAIGNIPSREAFLRARDVLAHRGPDDAGAYFKPESDLALGFRRLSIIDLSSAGAQPFHSIDGRFVMIYNGEIYNYVELKNELEGHYPFQTQSDTEVLLASYIYWGEECLQKLNGMFAFAIWDGAEKKLFCARDRFGVKPFFYAIKNEGFYFASEIKALSALGIRMAPNEKVVYQFLRYALVDHSEDTFFQGVKKLNAGHCLVWKQGHLNIKRYWNLEERVISLEQQKLPFNDTQKKFRELLEDAVRIRFRSDVPVGIAVSGGLDSNALLYTAYWVMKKNDIALFTRRTKTATVDEGKLLEPYLTPKQKQFWHTTDFGPEDSHLNDKMIRIQDQPYGNILVSGFQKIYDLAKQNNVTVLLEGQGGDEILAGYPRFVNNHVNDLFSKHQYVQVAKYLKKRETRKIVDQVFRSKIRHLISKNGQSFLPKIVNRNTLAQDFVNKYDPDPPIFPAPFKSELLNAQYHHIFYTKLPHMLRYGDHSSMAYSREVRFPFLDYRLVEFCMALPARFKITPTNQKVILRQMMKKMDMPDAISSRGKVLNNLGAQWFGNSYQEELKDILSSPTSRQRHYWNMANVRQITDRFFSQQESQPACLFQVIIMEKWLNQIKESQNVQYI